MVDDSESAERILTIATDRAVTLFGSTRLHAVFALGSLAHGGFSSLTSDIDVALVLDQVDADSARLVEELKRDTMIQSADPLAERLSIFWSDWEGVRTGAGQHSRLPAVDRVDLIDSGRLLWGTDARAGAVPPDGNELVIDAAHFVCTKFDDGYLASLTRPDELVAAGARAASKAALFPIRFMYTLASGRIGHNPDAARWYREHGGQPALADAAMQWRTEGIGDQTTATQVLAQHLVGTYREFFDAYRHALTAIPAGHELVQSFDRRRTAFDRLTAA